MNAFFLVSIFVNKKHININECYFTILRFAHWMNFCLCDNFTSKLWKNQLSKVFYGNEYGGQPIKQTEIKTPHRNWTKMTKVWKSHTFIIYVIFVVDVFSYCVLNKEFWIFYRMMVIFKTFGQSLLKQLQQIFKRIISSA